ncbi:MAG: LD-carboxypeptidase, partial [Rubrivivax sp.]
MTALRVFSPSGVVREPARLTLAVRRLRALGFEVEVDADARARRQRFAGSDEMRLAAVHRTAAAAPAVA